jgi:chitinase
MIHRITEMAAQLQGKRSVIPDVFKFLDRQQRQQIAKPFLIAMAHKFNPAIG